MSTRIDVWSDFVCPFCFAASLSLKELAEAHDIDVHWHSYELRPQGSPPISPEYLAQIKAGQPRLAGMIRDQFGVEVKFGPMGTDSRPALIADKYAEAQGAEKGQAFHEAVNHAYWIEGRDIGDSKVLREIATQVGLDPEGVIAAITDPAYVAQVDSDIEQAQSYGFGGVPAQLFENKYYVSGFRSTDDLVKVVEQVKAKAEHA